MVNYLQRECKGVTYFIKAGDTFYGIAAQYNVSLQDLIAANPQIANPNILYIGQRICVPVRCSGEFYTIKSGENLNIIAQKFRVPLAQLLFVNPQITNPNIIYVGQRICIPATGEQYKGCAIVLNRTSDTPTAFPEITGGVVYIHPAGDGKYAITFAALGLPMPKNIGNFDAYVGTLRMGEERYSAILSRSAPYEQEPTWAGTRVVEMNPFAMPDNTVTIAPMNVRKDIRGEPILEGIVVECR